MSFTFMLKLSLQPMVTQIYLTWLGRFNFFFWYRTRRKGIASNVFPLVHNLLSLKDNTISIRRWKGLISPSRLSLQHCYINKKKT